VFVGLSSSVSETAEVLTLDPDKITAYLLTGCTRSMFANRLAYFFDLRGPSLAVDTACSSSATALQLAVDAIRQNQCDAAIVAGAQMNLTPFSTMQFQQLGTLADDGCCKSFDEKGVANLNTYMKLLVQATATCAARAL
jgi:fatty acid synthase